MFQLMHRPMPCWYDLGFNWKDESVTFRIAQGVWESSQDLLQRWVAAIGCKAVPPFIRPGRLPWGFGPIFSEIIFDNEGWVTFAFEIPHLFRLKTSDCSESERVKRLKGPSVSLEVLGKILSTSAEIDSSIQHPRTQLATFGISASQDYRLGGYGIWGIMSKELRDWVSRQSDTLATQVTQAMQAAYIAMVGSNNFLYETRMVLREKGIVGFHTFGDACDLYPDPSSWNCEDGYTLNPHNVDNVIQQMTLFVGLAALCQLAREAGL